MKSRRRLFPATLAIATLVIVVAPGVAARGRATETRAQAAFWSATAHELRLRGAVDYLAADGNRVAFTACRPANWLRDTVVGSWQPSASPVFATGEPSADACVTAPCCAEYGPVAVASDRFAYWQIEGGIGVYGTLFTLRGFKMLITPEEAGVFQAGRRSRPPDPDRVVSPVRVSRLRPFTDAPSGQRTSVG